MPINEERAEVWLRKTSKLPLPNCSEFAVLKMRLGELIKLEPWSRWMPPGDNQKRLADELRPIDLSMKEPLGAVTAIMRLSLPTESNSTPSIPPRVSNALKRWKRFRPDDVPQGELSSRILYGTLRASTTNKFKLTRCLRPLYASSLDLIDCGFQMYSNISACWVA